MQTLTDITGVKFGKTTAVKRAGMDGYFQLWECLCECGNTHTTRQDRLLRGTCTSCGCALRNYQSSLPRIINIAGSRFGKLVVIEFSGKDKKRHALWKCKCDCGKERIVAGTLLITGSVSCCGCSNGKEGCITNADGTRICNNCGETKPLLMFHRNSKCTGGHISTCKKCLASKCDSTAKWLKSRYGLTREQFKSMQEKQDGKCAICLRPTERLCVDHCHTTKQVRGLLCGHCNSAIGLFGENAEVMLRAIEYLKKPDLTVN